MSKASRIDVDTKRLPAELRDLDRPNLVALSYALRHPETWPEDFVWDFDNCDACAMGLARELWASIPEVDKDTGATIMARTFAISYTDASIIFFASNADRAADWSVREERGRFGRWRRRVIPYKSITPDMVAGVAASFRTNRSRPTWSPTRSTPCWSASHERRCPHPPLPVRGRAC
jgi:hypothetical protein